MQALGKWVVSFLLGGLMEFIREFALKMQELRAERAMRQQLQKERKEMLKRLKEASDEEAFDRAQDDLVGRDHKP